MTYIISNPDVAKIYFILKFGGSEKYAKWNVLGRLGLKLPDISYQIAIPCNFSYHFI